MRYSDNGEPAGTAGMPIMDVMRLKGIVNCCIVVVRYFGGILLGGGGLVRAYSHAASIGIAAAGIVTMKKCLICRLACDYSQYGRLGSLVPECGGNVMDTSFGECVTLSFTMTREDFDRFAPQLADAACGSVTAEILGEDYFEVAGS